MWLFISPEPIRGEMMKWLRVPRNIVDSLFKEPWRVLVILAKAAREQVDTAGSILGNKPPLLGCNQSTGNVCRDMQWCSQHPRLHRMERSLSLPQTHLVPESSMLYLTGNGSGGHHDGSWEQLQFAHKNITSRHGGQFTTAQGYKYHKDQFSSNQLQTEQRQMIDVHPIRLLPGH